MRRSDGTVTLWTDHHDDHRRYWPARVTCEALFGWFLDLLGRPPAARPCCYCGLEILSPVFLCPAHLVDERRVPCQPCAGEPCLACFARSL